VDEIGTGLDRVGRAFGFQLWEHAPDIITLGKSLGGGVMPIAAVALRREFGNACRGLAFDSTFAGTPAACAAAVTTLQLLEGGDLFAMAREHGTLALRYLRAALARHQLIKEIRGTGLLLAIEFAGDRRRQAQIAARVVAELLEQGVFSAQSRFTSSLLLMPPLVMDARTLTQGLETIVTVIDTLPSE
jgi:4-aminobutyrate aminotransferase-like enzyme